MEWGWWGGDGGVGRWMVRMVGMGMAVRGGGYVLCAGTGWCLGIYKNTDVEGVKTCR